jgi:dihydroorotase
MEVTGVRNQIMFAKEEGFQGHLHIHHTSTPEAVEIVNSERGNMSISCGCTPHHLTLSTEENMSTTDGMQFKVNPPIRERAMKDRLMQYLRSGMIDLIETDHAPHLEKTKVYIPGVEPTFYMSGIRSLNNYASFLRGLSSSGMSEERIRALTYSNPKRIFSKIKE